MRSNLPTTFRNLAFWTLDALKGRKIKKALTDIEESFALNSFDSLKSKNERPLKELLDKAVQETVFYENLKNYSSLEDFPVTNKNIVRDNFDHLLIKSSKNARLHKMFTSGSTGIPFMVYQNREKRIRNTADTIYFADSSGYTVGDKLLYLRLWSKKLSKGRIQAFIQNIDQINVEDLDDEAFIKNLLSRLQKDKSPKGWLGYPSGLEKICDYLDSINSKPLDCNIKSIIGMSESLSDDVRSRMWHYFNTPMVSRYSNFENGILAQQAVNSDYFVINWASYILEILDFDKDEPVKEGELGRIVVTDLYNHATPLIRYDTGDVGSLIKDPMFPFPVLKTVEGRKTDILLNTQGKMTSPFKFMGFLIDFPEMKQVQYLQVDKTKYIIKINIEEQFVREDELKAKFKSYMGEDADVEIEYVDEIPLLNSKKRKITRNLYAENTNLPPKQKLETI